jgi:hypothetical protein
VSNSSSRGDDGEAGNGTSCSSNAIASSFSLDELAPNSAFTRAYEAWTRGMSNTGMGHTLNDSDRTSHTKKGAARIGRWTPYF